MNEKEENGGDTKNIGQLFFKLCHFLSKNNWTDGFSSKNSKSSLPVHVKGEEKMVLVYNFNLLFYGRNSHETAPLKYAKRGKRRLS